MRHESAPSRLCTPTSGRCKCRAELLLSLVLQLSKVLLEMPWWQWQCRRAMLMGAKGHRLHPAI